MKMITGILFATLLLLLLSACGAPNQHSDSATQVDDSTADVDESMTELKLLYWQAPSTMNPYLSSGTKDIEAASVVVEPLAHFDVDGNRVPILAVEIPTHENGGISEDYTSITWKLRDDIVWSDSSKFTANDVVFTWEYCSHEEFGCTASNLFDDVEAVVAVDDFTVQVNFYGPTAYPYGPFIGSVCPILQREQFSDCLGLKAQQCTNANFNPIGTGAFMVDEFRANDVITYVANPLYRDPNKPFFKKVTLKGGGDVTSAARAVLQTGEFDFAWNLQVEPEILQNMAAAGKGEILTGFAAQVERIIVNQTNADPSLPKDQRSVYLSGNNPHPFLSDYAVRRALSLAIDRNVLVQTGYGVAGKPGCNVIPAPEKFVSTSNEECQEQDLEEANRILDEAGWIQGNDGIREKNGVRLSMLFQTSTNSVRQGNQTFIKQMWAQIGVETELRNIDGAVFFGGDPASPDTLQKFFADVQMYTNNFEGIDPSKYVEGWRCEEAPGPDNQWLGQNTSRGCSAEYDALVLKLQATFDPDERVEIIKQLNDMVIQNYWEIPLIHRARVSARSTTLKGFELNGWDSELWTIADWYREEATTD